MMTIHTHKYVRHSIAGFVVWPFGANELHHAHMGRLLRTNPDLAGGQILSAGFVSGLGEGKPICYGKSESLGIAAARDDTPALRAAWGFPA